MKLIQKRFNNIARENPLLSSYMCFAKLCQIIRFTPYQVRKWFNLLVEKDDYLQSESDGICEYLYTINS